MFPDYFNLWIAYTEIKGFVPYKGVRYIVTRLESGGKNFKDCEVMLLMRG